ncbi:MAG TPA: hypothetical protein VEB66_05825 [Opitutaceae bacterium]|nr:hypothetical protein [Opitutaceae bacterium]
MKGSTAVPPGAVVLATSERFFVRSVPLASDSPAAAQVELALEALSPFPLAQLYHGYATDAAGGHALVFAAYRRAFSAEETAGWGAADTVVPELALWLGASAPKQPAIWMRENDGLTELAAWDGRSSLPVFVQARRLEPGQEDAWLEEVRARTGLPAGASVRRAAGPLVIRRDQRTLVIATAAGEFESRFGLGVLDQLDVRDKSALAANRGRAARDRVLWRAFAGTLAALAACALLDGGLALGRSWLAKRRALVATQAPVAARIEAAQDLAGRLEQIATQRVMPFEMLAAVNDRRPRTVEFTRVTTSGLWRMDIEAQTVNAGDLRDFETQLRRLGSVARVAVRDPRMREGLTTFRLEVEFKPGWTGGGA